MTAVAMVGTTLGLAACGGEPSARDNVNDYIRQVNAIQLRSVTDFKRTNETNIAFSKDEIKGDDAVAGLERGRIDIDETRQELSELVPPKEARRLHSQMLLIFDRNVDFARETTRLASYVYGAEQALRPLDGADRKLQRTLRTTRAGLRQARALDTFAATVAGILRDLRALEVPFVLLPSHGDQVRRLDATRVLAERLERALRDRNPRRVARLLKEFRRDAKQRRPRRKLADQALTEYNRRYRELNESYTTLRREHDRLERSLD